MADEWATRQALIQAGLVPVVVYAHSGTVPAGQVIGLTPTSGTVVAVNSAVTMTVSSGPASTVTNVTVPTLTGLTWKAATDALQAAFLSLDKYVFQVNSAAQGSVVAQSVTAGSSVAPGTKVQLTLSAGAARVPATVAVPLPLSS